MQQYWDNDDRIKVRITNLDTGDAINNATVKASFYLDRDRANPADTPGTAVSGLTNLALSYIADSSGWYQVLLDESNRPKPGVTYTRVIIADTPSGIRGHWEDEVTVRVRHSTDN
jgi:hypothetical protein